jgi:hypothetical protein
MRSHPLLATGLFCLLLAALPSQARAGTVSAPPRKGYQFAHGAVTQFRNWALALDIHTEDVADANNNGTFRVGFQAKMPEFVVQSFPDGSGILNTTFEQITTNINGQEVMNAVPPALDKYGTFHRYNLLVNPNGTCNCSQLPALVYDTSGQYPHEIALGDLITYLHPSLPHNAAWPAHAWTTPLPFGLTPKHPFLLRSVLQHTKSGWNVVSNLSQPINVTITAQQYMALEPHDTLSSNAPVTVTGSITLSSTLGLVAADGVGVVPYNAKPGTKGKLCSACTGYPLPLQGHEHLHLLYSQNGAELSLVDLNARLQIALSS